MRIGPTPLTQHLLDRNAFKDDPIVIVDVGARGGFNPEFLAFRDQCRIICFEPNAAECDRLKAVSPPWVEYIPKALSDTKRTATLYQTRLSYCVGLYPANWGYMSRLLNGPNNEVIGEEKIEVEPLTIKADFIKLDAEGAELDILKGADISDTLGVLTEIRFHREINGSPRFSDVDGWLNRRGFDIYDLDFSRQSRKVLPYPGFGCFERFGFHTYTTSGQIQDGNALYFRDGRAMPEIKRLKLACLLELYTLADCAAELVPEELRQYLRTD